MQLRKFEQIINYFSKTKEAIKTLDTKTDLSKIQIIENLIGEAFPKELKNLYTKYNGDRGEGIGSFLGHSFINLNEIIKSLEFSKTLIQSKNPKLLNPKKSEQLIQSIIEIYKSQVPIKRKFGFIKQAWYQIKFDCSPNSMGGPYLYQTKNTTAKELEIFDLDAQSTKQIQSLTKKLHALEKDDYNWDTMEFVVFGNGNQDVKRTLYNFDKELPLASTPKNTIKKKYFHIKWIPVISDFGGNYIGIDLDPDEKGIKGQVIIVYTFLSSYI